MSDWDRIRQNLHPSFFKKFPLIKDRPFRRRKSAKPITQAPWKDTPTRYIWGYTCLDDSNNIPLETAEREIHDYFTAHHSVGNWAIGCMFRDGSDMSDAPFDRRPGAADLARAVNPGDVVVIARMAGGFNTIPDCQRIATAWWRRGITLKILDIEFNSSDEQWRHWFNVVAAWQECRARRTKRRWVAKKNQGRWTGKAPYGFKVIAHGKLIPWVEQRKSAQYVIELAKRGLDMREVLDWLKIHLPLAPNGKPWNKATIATIRKKEVQLQRMEQKAEKSGEGLPWANCVVDESRARRKPGDKRLKANQATTD